MTVRVRHGSNPQEVTTHFLSDSPIGLRIIVTKPLNFAIKARVRLIHGTGLAGDPMVEHLNREVIAHPDSVYQTVGDCLKMAEGIAS